MGTTTDIRDKVDLSKYYYVFVIALTIIIIVVSTQKQKVVDSTPTSQIEIGK